MLAAPETASKRYIANAFSRHIGCSPLASLCRRANPDEETTDWRAVCGRTARTVRRAGTARAVPDPYQTLGRERILRNKLLGQSEQSLRLNSVVSTIRHIFDSFFTSPHQRALVFVSS